MRDAATLNQLVALANMESMNAQLILEGLSREDRALYLNKMAIQQMRPARAAQAARAAKRGCPGQIFHFPELFGSKYRDYLPNL